MAAQPSSCMRLPFERKNITEFLQGDEAAPSVAEKLEELKGELPAPMSAVAHAGADQRCDWWATGAGACADNAHLHSHTFATSLGA